MQEKALIVPEKFFPLSDLTIKGLPRLGMNLLKDCMQDIVDKDIATSK